MRACVQNMGLHTNIENVIEEKNGLLLILLVNIILLTVLQIYKFINLCRHHTIHHEKCYMYILH